MPGRNEAAAPRVVLDCRWLGHTGVGRITTQLLHGLGEVDPPGVWTLWGPDETEALAWRGVQLVVERGSPLRGGAQATLMRVPAADVTIFPHAVRPLVPRRRTAVILHDVIPVHWAETVAQRAAWRGFLALSVATAGSVLTPSQATADAARTTLGLRRRPITVYRPPADLDFADRVAVARTGHAPLPYALYVGQAKPHKNLERTIRAFAGSSFARRGGRFVIAGAVDPGLSRLRRFIQSHAFDGVDVVPRCTDDELVALYAAAKLVVQPSLEEGFGLPVLEATLAGISVCCSDIPALREAAAGFARLFDPLDERSIRNAIDSLASADPDGDLRARALATYPLGTSSELALDVLSSVGLLS